ncbi:MAG: hypothetical protein Q8904_05730 [Bacteroidota bacterium]|nr:hypothetical protein [Bacteroidota bacterium]
MKKIISLVTIFIFCQSLFSQISTVIPSSEAIALTSVADTHSWAAFNNPAMLGYVDKPEFGLQFENRYLLSELSTKSIQLALPSNLINTGISFSYFGYSLYHEMITGIGFARNFSDKFAMGVQFNYYTAFFSASNSYRGALLPQIGLSVHLSPLFSFGFNTFNPFQTNIQTEYVIKRLPSVFSLGTEYLFSEELVWRTQIDKEVSSNYRFATGFEYQMLQSFRVKLGAYDSGYLVPCLGVGFKTGAFRIDLNCEMHPLLGLNTLAAIKYRFGK